MRGFSDSGSTHAPGVCRVCGCTENRACIIQWGPGESLDTVKACWWIDAKKTLCSNPACLAKVPLEQIEREILMESAT